MGIGAEIGCFGVPVIFLALVTLWRRGDGWGHVPSPRRFLLAVSASRNWWLAYSFAYLIFLMGWCGYSFQHSVPPVLVAIGLAALFSLLRLPK